MAGTAAWIDVLPNLNGFASKIVSGGTGPAKNAGNTIGKLFASSMNAAASSNVLREQVDALKAAEKKAAAAVSEATAKIGKARSEQKAATLNLQAAEARYQEVVAKNGPTSAAALRAASQVETARGRLEVKTTALSRAEQVLRERSNAQKETASQLKVAEDKLGTTTDKLGKSATAAAKSEGVLSTATSTLRTISQKTGGITQTFRTKIDEWRNSANTAEKSSKALASAHAGLGNVSTWAAAKFATIATVVQSTMQKAASAISSNLNGAIARADQINNFPVVMKNIGYSADDAAKSCAKISEALDGLPSTMSDLTGMVQQLAPLTTSLDEATDIALSLNNALLAGGASSIEASNALTQYTQMLAAGKVDQQAWNSLVSAMPGQLNTLAEKLLGAGKKQADLYQAMKTGKVSFDDFNAALVDLNENGFGQYASFADQAVGATQGIGTAITNVSNRIQKQITKVLEVFGISSIAAVINNWSSGFGEIGDKAAAMAQTIIDWMREVHAVLQDNGALQTLNGIWDTLKNTVTSFAGDGILATLWERMTAPETVGNAINSVAGALEWVTSTVTSMGETVMEWVNATYETLRDNGSIEGFANLWDKVKEAISGFVDGTSGFGEVWQRLTAPETVGAAIEKISSGLNWLMDNLHIIVPLLATFAAGFVAVKGAIIAYNAVQAIHNGLTIAYQVALNAVKVAQTAAAVAGRVFNAVLNANPIGLLIMTIATVITLIVKLLTETETGRAIMQTVFEWLGNVCSTVGEWFSNMGETISNVWQTVCDWFGRVGEWFSGLGETFTGICTNIGDFFTGMGETISNAWETCVGTVSEWWESLKTGVIEAFENAWQGISDFFTGICENLETAWNNVCSFFTDIWDWIKTNIIDSYITSWNILKDKFEGFMNNIKDKWEWLKGRFKDIWDWIDSHIITPFKEGWDNAKNAFTTVVEKIQEKWDWLKGKFQDVWDWIDSKIITPFKDGLQSLGDKAEGVVQMISTAWEGLKDAAAKPVKWVIDTVYTGGIQKVWNSIAGAVGLENLKLPDANFSGFARGGICGGINPGYAPGHDTMLAMTSPGEAWMVPEWTRAVGADNVYRWNRLARQQGPDAVRADMGLAGYAEGGISGIVTGAISKVKETVSNIVDGITDFLSDPGAWITSKIVEPVKNMVLEITGSSWGKMIAEFPIQTAKKLVEKAKQAVKDFFGGSGSGSDVAAGNVAYTPTAGVEQWRPLVLRVLAELGQDASWANTVLRRMNQESGGNPNAINRWDINAQRGDPSRGLMQTIGSTFNAYAGPYRSRGIYDPLANIYAGCAYAISRYGSLAGMNRAGGYAQGGIVPTLYDRGGILPAGNTFVTNQTGRPELVLDPQQTNTLLEMERRPVVNMNITIPDAHDPYSEAEIYVRTARHLLA